MDDDAALLRRYADQNDDRAFAEFARRRVDFVYSVALRRVQGDAHLAHDVTQQVFIAVARRAAELARHPALLGWLHRCAGQRAIDAVRAEARRRVRETAASTDPALTGEPRTEWSAVARELDGALDALREPERELVLARFFEKASFAEIGTRLGVSEAAAQMRAARALDKLRAALARRGVTSTASALGLALGSQAVTAAPASVVAGAVGAAGATAAVAAGVGAGAGVGTAATTATFMSSTKLTVIVAASTLAVGGAGWGVYQARREKPEPAPALAATPVASAAPTSAASMSKPAKTEKDRSPVSAGVGAVSAAGGVSTSGAAGANPARAKAREAARAPRAKMVVPPANLIASVAGNPMGAKPPPPLRDEAALKAVQEVRAWFEQQMDATGLWTTYDWEDHVARIGFEIEGERRLASRLTPEQFQAYLIRDSITARELAGRLVNFEPDWPERAAIFEIEREFLARWGVYGMPKDPALRAEREAARKEADGRLATALGAERFQAWAQTKEGAR